MKKHQGSCLCGKVTYEVMGEFDKFFFCHCSRCRKVTGSAHGANLFSTTAELHWTSGQELISIYQHPGTRFTKSFCSVCSSSVPTLKEGNRLQVPAGSLDTDLETSPTGHIQMGSKANWDDSLEDVPKFEVYP